MSGNAHSEFSLDRLRKRNIMLGDASNKCSSQGCPTRPPCGGACESIHSRGAALLLTVSLPVLFLSRNCAEKFRLRGYHTPTPPHYCLFSSPYARFVKEQRRKNLQGVACKIFRALDNDDELKSKHARSGILPRALIAILRSHVFVSALSFM